MLTKTDLKQIEKIVENKTSGIENKLSGKISDVEKRLTKQLKSIKKDTKYTVNFLDRDQLHTEKRVQRIEDQLDLPELPRTPHVSSTI